MKRIILALAVLAAGCASPNPDATPVQKAINATAVSCKDISAAIVSTDAAIKANVLKGSNADTAVKALTQAQAGCNATAVSLQAAAAAASAPASAPK
jgi:hypothetical protein